MAENKYEVHYREPTEQFITEVHIILHFKKKKTPLYYALTEISLAQIQSSNHQTDIEYFGERGG